MLASQRVHRPPSLRARASWPRPLTTGLLTAVLILAACGPRTHSQLVPVSSSPEDLYDCVLYELARAGFTIIDTDRASGFVRAQEEYMDWMGEYRLREIFATALVPPGESTSRLQISSNRHAHEQADAIVVACAPTSAVAFPVDTTITID